MNESEKYFIEEMNRRGKKGEAFAFLIDFDFQKPQLFSINNSSELIRWDIPGHKNFDIKKEINKPFYLKTKNISSTKYKTAFDRVQKEIKEGNTYLLNLTFPTPIETNYSLEEIFFKSKALYKILLKDHFVCFSPEIFVRIENGIISSHPMKGTIDAMIDHAEEILMNDPKELAEHNTIVDLIRNDMSLVAENVTVERFRYVDRIKTHQGELLQISSKITGKLPDNYSENIGTIIHKMLPAGSICGAPKDKTVSIIKEAEQYDRGFYTGIFGIFDGKNLDSCVLIRFIEKTEDGLVFKSGGGITFLSNCKLEYEELKQKVYVPIT